MGIPPSDIGTINITKRYIGKEPLNPVTHKYNEAIKNMLPQYGIEVHELERIEAEGQVISASSVRRYLAESNWEQLRRIVPDTTWQYLQSDEAKPVINKIKQHYKYH